MKEKEKFKKPKPTDFVFNLDFNMLQKYEDNNYALVCAYCNNIISSTFNELEVAMNWDKPVAVGIRVDDDYAEFYCKSCFDKLQC